MAVKRGPSAKASSSPRTAKRAYRRQPEPNVVDVPSCPELNVVSLISTSSEDRSQAHVNERDVQGNDTHASKAAVLEILFDQGLETLTEERAEFLVESTREQYESHGVEAWAEACMVAMAIDNEIDDEVTDVRIAMADSLREAEAAQPSTSLADEPVPVILDHYNRANSQVAAFLMEMDRLTLLEPSVLVDLLELETRCAKWYGASSRAYFKDMLDGMRALEKKDSETIRTTLIGALKSMTASILVQGRDDFFAGYQAEDVVTLL